MILFSNSFPLPGFAADASFNGIDPVTGRGVGFLPITVTPDVGIGNPFPGRRRTRSLQFRPPPDLLSLRPQT